MNPTYLYDAANLFHDKGSVNMRLPEFVTKEENPGDPQGIFITGEDFTYAVMPKTE